MEEERARCVDYSGALGGQYRIFELEDGTVIKGTNVDNSTREQLMREARNYKIEQEQKRKASYRLKVQNTKIVGEDRAILVSRGDNKILVIDDDFPDVEEGDTVLVDLEVK